MRKSRLNLFKSTSLLIAVFGVVMIISIIFVAGYVGFSMVSSGITNEISSGTQYDELANIKTQYNELDSKFDTIKTKYTGNSDKITKYDNAKLELERANSAIQNAQSALDTGKSSAEVESRVNFAKEKLETAQQAYDNLT